MRMYIYVNNLLGDINEGALKNKVMKYMWLDLLDIDTLIPVLNKYQFLTLTNLYDLKNEHTPPKKELMH